MTKYQLCRWLSRELRAINPRDLSRATRTVVQLSAACKEPLEFRALFAAANFDKTPVPVQIDPELWPERPVDSDWNRSDPDEYGSLSFEEDEMESNQKVATLTDAQANAAIDLLLCRVERERPNLLESLNRPLANPHDVRGAREVGARFSEEERSYLIATLDGALAFVVASTGLTTAVPQA